MQYRFIPSWLWWAVVFSGCGSCGSGRFPDDAALQNSGLEDSATASADLLDQKYAYLQTMACEEGRWLADSLNAQYDHASERLFALDELLAGPVVEGGGRPDNAFAEDGLAAEALLAAQQFYGLAEAIAGSDSTRQRIAAYAAPLRAVKDMATWYQRDAQQAPPAVTAAIERWVADMGRAKQVCTSALLAPCR